MLPWYQLLSSPFRVALQIVNEIPNWFLLLLLSQTVLVFTIAKCEEFLLQLFLFLILQTNYIKNLQACPGRPLK